MPDAAVTSELQRLTVALCVLLATSTRATYAQTGPPRADFTIAASDFRLVVPSSVAAGWRTVRLRATGHEFHHAVLLRVASPAAADSAIATLATWTRDWDRPVPGTISVGGIEETTTDDGGDRPDAYGVVRLEPGTYLVVCMVRGGAGALHVNRGMHALLRVTGASNGATRSVAAPAADLTVRTSDYSYRLSRTTIAPGWHLVAVQNDGPAEHATEVARLRDGRHLADVVQPTPGTSDPVAAIVGGATRIAVGARSYTWLRLERGTYLIHCPIRSAAGWRHEERGMVAELTVR